MKLQIEIKRIRKIKRPYLKITSSHFYPHSLILKDNKLISIIIS